MHKDVKDQLTLTNCLPGKGLVLSLWCEDLKKIDKFKETCYLELTREVNWFHQCDCETYQMFEFWIQPARLDMVREQAQEVAKAMKMELADEVRMENFHNPV